MAEAQLGWPKLLLAASLTFPYRGVGDRWTSCSLAVANADRFSSIRPA
jgi:hypothetical protein